MLPSWSISQSQAAKAKGHLLRLAVAVRLDDAGEELFLIRWIRPRRPWEPAGNLQPGLAVFKAMPALEPHLPADDQLLADEPEDVAGSQASVSADEHAS